MGKSTLRKEYEADLGGGIMRLIYTITTPDGDCEVFATKTNAVEVLTCNMPTGSFSIARSYCGPARLRAKIADWTGYDLNEIQVVKKEEA